MSEGAEKGPKGAKEGLPAKPSPPKEALQGIGKAQQGLATPTAAGKEKPQKQSRPAKDETYDPWTVLLHPHLAEKSMGMVDLQNRLTFIVAKRATKREIKEAVERGFGVEVVRVNVEVTGSRKKAYVTLSPKHPAADIGTRLGMI